MRTGSESKSVWALLKKRLDFLKWHAQRFEDKRAPGIPDVNICLPNRGDIWIELKYVEIPSLLGPRARVNIGLRREQYIWMMQAARAGRRVCLLARIEESEVYSTNTGWWCWFDAGAWKIARRTADWSALQATGIRHLGPDQFLASL